MKRNYVVLFTTAIVILLIVAYACKKDEEETNNGPQAPAAAKALWVYSDYFFADGGVWIMQAAINLMLQQTMHLQASSTVIMEKTLET